MVSPLLEESPPLEEPLSVVPVELLSVLPVEVPVEPLFPPLVVPVVPPVVVPPLVPVEPPVVVPVVVPAVLEEVLVEPVLAVEGVWLLLLLAAVLVSDSLVFSVAFSVVFSVAFFVSDSDSVETRVVVSRLTYLDFSLCLRQPLKLKVAAIITAKNECAPFLFISHS
ncbi:MAG: hypothetical protein ACLR2E_19600 [Lachnospiraceae bacterium]